MKRAILPQSIKIKPMYVKRICSIAIAIMLVLLMVTSCQRPLPEPVITPAPVETPAPSPKVEANKPKGADETDRSGYKIIRLIPHMGIEGFEIGRGELYISYSVRKAAEKYKGQDVYIPVYIRLINYQGSWNDELKRMYLPKRVMELIRLQELGYGLYAP